MKHFFTFLFLISIFVFSHVDAKNNFCYTDLFSYENVTPTSNKAPAFTINGSITGTDTVCENSPSSKILFKGSGGTAPYTFTYNLNGGPNLTITTTSGDSIFLSAPATATGVFIYTLTNVSDASTQQTPLNESISLTVGASPDVTLNSSEYLSMIDGKPGFKYCNGGTGILFTNGSANVASNSKYVISWGDGSPDFNVTSWSSVTHNYAFGLWTLRYTVTGVSGCVVSKDYTILVNSTSKVSFGSDNSSKDMCVGSDYSFIISNTESNPDGTIYTLTYNDGTPSIIYYTNPPSRVNHTFNKSSCGYTSVTATGTYINSFSATIVASNLCGSDAVTVAPIYVSTPPVANFTFPSSKICATVPACFADVSTGSEVTALNPTCTIPKRVWTISPSLGVTLSTGSYGDDFGNAIPTSWISGTATICPVFTIPGTYTIKLIAGNRCGIDQKDTVITVEPALLPHFTIDGVQGCTPFSVNTTNTTDFTNNPSVTYLWDVTYSPGNCGVAPEKWNYSNNTSKNSLSPSFNFETPGKYTISLSLFNSCGIVKTSQTVEVTKPPTVIINNIANSCDVASINPTAVVDGCTPLATGLSYTWSFPGGNPVSSISPIPGTVNYNTPGTYTVSLQVTNADCGSATTDTRTFTINKTPDVNDIPNQEVCNGSLTVPVKFSGKLPNATYNWKIDNPTIGLIPTAGKDSIPTFTAVNNTSTPLTSIVTVTPVSNGCSGTSKTFTIVVNPTPVVTFSLPNQIVCSEDNTNQVSLSSTTPTNIKFSWAAVVPSGITGVTAITGTNLIPVQKLINTTNAPLVINYKAYASFMSADSCKGADFTYTITVNPKALIQSNETTTICSGTSFSITPSNGSGNMIPDNTTYTWSSPVSNPSGSIGGGSSQNTPKPSISQTLTNSSNVVATATYSVTPHSGICTGQPFDILVSVHPTPEVNALNDTTLCSGEEYNQLVGFSGNMPGTVFNWICSNDSIGNVLSGSGSIPSFITVNATSKPLKTKITVTPVLNACTGTSKSFTITVNPIPKINPVTDDVLCSNSTTGTISFSGNVAGTVFSWVNSNKTIGLKDSTGVNMPAFKAVNNGITPVIDSITVTPIFNGCAGLPFTFTRTVNPTPIVNQPLDMEICSGIKTACIKLSGNIANSKFNWTSTNNLIGLPYTSGTDSIPGFTATNNTTAQLVDTITIIPDVNGCSGIPQRFTIKVNPTPAVIFSKGSQTICSGTLTSVVNLTSNVAGSTLVWNAVQPNGITGVVTTGTSQIPTQNLINTTNQPIDVIYSSKAIYQGGICEGNVYDYIITVNPVPSIKTKEITICNGGTFSFLPEDGNGNIIPLNTLYTWTTPVLNPAKSISGGYSQLYAQDSVSQTLTNKTNQIATATYTVTPVPEICSGNPFTIVVTVNPTPDIHFSQPNQIINSGNTSIPVITSFTTGNVKYNWTVDVPSGITGQIKPTTNEIPSQTLVNLTNKKLTVIYTVTTVFADESSCVGTTASYLITVNPPVTTSYITSNYNGYGINVSEGKDGWIDLTVGGGSGTYTYSWTSTNGFTSSTQDIANIPAGVYTVVIKDGCCDSVILNITMTEPTPFSIKLDHVHNTCHGDSNGKIKILITKESVGPYDFLLEKSGVTIKKITGLALTNYEFNGLYPGIYDMKVTDAQGFMKVLKDTVSEPPALVSSVIFQNNVGCFGENTGTATVKASGGTGKLNYKWLNTLPVQNAPTATGLTAGTYFVLITDSVGCSISDTVAILQPEAPLNSLIIASTNPTCSRPTMGSATVSVTGGTKPYNYLWNTIPEQMTATAANLTEGNYKVKVTDAHGCESYAFVTLMQPVGIIVSLKSVTNLSCAGDSTGSVSVNVSGGLPFEVTPGNYVYDYSWSGPNGFTSKQRDLNNLQAGKYILIVTDQAGCSKVIPVILTEPEKLKLTTTVTPVTCFGSNNASIKADISGGVKPYRYVWSNLGNGTFQDNLSPGDYAVTVIDSMGCQATESIKIKEAYFSYHPVITPVSCYGANDGTINLNVLGGLPPVSITWTDNPVAGNVRNRLGPGSYTATLKDGSLCSFTETFVILEPLKLNLTADITDALNCNISTSGAISLKVTGGTSPYSFKWSNEAKTDKIENVDAGNYSVTVTDAKGCNITGSYTVKRQVPLSIDVATSANFDCVTKIVKQLSKAEITGGVPPYQIKWSSGDVSGAMNENMETTQSGLVMLQVIDSKGCTATNSFNVDIRNPGIKYQFVECNKFAFQFNAVVPNEFENYTYSWDFGDGGISSQQNVQHVYATAGSFTVRLILKSVSCTSYYNQVVSVDPGPMLSIDKAPKFCIGDSVVIHVKGADKYRWNNNSVSDSIVIKHEGQYIVNGTSNNGCLSTLSFEATLFDFSDYTIKTDRNEVTSDNIPLHLWSERIDGSLYYWDFGDGKTDEGNDITHLYEITRDGYYDVKLKIISSHGCEQLVTKRIWITQNTQPNTFTPNGDGKNDVFMKDWHIQVYNRNGILFYEGKDGWDGTRNGKPAANDTYFYVVYFSSESGSKTTSGFVTVIR